MNSPLKQDSFLTSSAANPYLIAEIGTNHNRDFETARQLIQKAKDAGFDAVKFQTYDASEIVNPNLTAESYGLSQTYGNISAYEMFDKYLKTPKTWFPELIHFAHSIGLHVGTAIHGTEGLDWYKTQPFDFLKIASMDHNNHSLLQDIVNHIETPVLISFGLARLDDIEESIRILREHRPGFGVFHCCALYPPKYKQLRLSNIKYLKDRYSVHVGFSDHTIDELASLISLYNGATFFEKHITMDENQIGPDHSFAVNPVDARSFCLALRTALSDQNPHFQALSSEEDDKRQVYLKSCFAANDLPADHILTASDLRYARPGTGILASDYRQLIGRRLARPIPSWTMISMNDLI